MNAIVGRMGRLVYVMGPSGAGKDSIVDWARSQLSPSSRGIHFARRTITRPARAEGEQHLPVDGDEFERRLATGAFAMHWRANGYAYGIGQEIRAWLTTGDTVLVNGSRAHLPQAQRDFPQLEAVLVSAPTEVLRARLLARGRESVAEIDARLARAQGQDQVLASNAALIKIVNDGDLAKAGAALLKILTRTNRRPERNDAP